MYAQNGGWIILSLNPETTYTLLNQLALPPHIWHSDDMNKDISTMILDLCSAIECVRPLSTQEEGYRQRALGVREGAWTAEDDAMLRAFVLLGWPRQHIAVQLDRTNMSVRKRIQSLRRSGFIEAVK